MKVEDSADSDVVLQNGQSHNPLGSYFYREMKDMEHFTRTWTCGGVLCSIYEKECAPLSCVFICFYSPRPPSVLSLIGICWTLSTAAELISVFLLSGDTHGGVCADIFTLLASSEDEFGPRWFPFGK